MYSRDITTTRNYLQWGKKPKISSLPPFPTASDHSFLGEGLHEGIEGISSSLTVGHFECQNN